MKRLNLKRGVLIMIITIVFSCILSTIKVYDIADLSSTTKTLKTANFWKLTTPIYINDANPNSNWSKTASDNDWCSGSGTYSDPYLIENVIIQGMDFAYGIRIQNSYVNFIIKNCTTANIKRFEQFDFGIEMYNVANGKLIDNNFSYNREIGIFLSYCDNNTLLGNLANDNFESGIRLICSSNNIITGNTFSENKEVGIQITNLSNNNTISQNTVNSNYNNGIIINLESNNNTITENIINYHKIGILLYLANGNIVIGNTLTGNQICIEESQSSYNTIENNDCRGDPKSAVPGYNLALLISLIGVISPISAIIIRKRFKNNINFH